ncbi:unnamed protein product [Rotaria sp. Silwood1]|nr:unnamed protein product [Rotaria sp. Silwood1]CAF4985382.1 unnamed protein product [Rotaria sp. Silwood1]
MTEQRPSEVPPRSTGNITQRETKSRIPIRISGIILSSSEITGLTTSSSLSSSFVGKRKTSTNKISKIPIRVIDRHRLSMLPKQNSAIENSTQIANDQKTHQSIDSGSDSSIKSTQKRNEVLKTYYDSFPNINDAINETSPDIQKAKQFTESILLNLPSGDIDDRNTLCHVLNKLLGYEDQKCLFYNSENGINLHDTSQNLADINSKDRPFVLKLSSSEGLENINNVQTEHDDLKFAQILTNIIEQKQTHPAIEDIIERLAKVHNVDKKRILIKHVYAGTFNVVYTVMDLPWRVIKSLKNLKRKLRKKFKEFLSLKIHPLLYRPSFDISYFDERGNKTFPSESQKFNIGPPGRTQLYITPSGWTRYGFKVLGKYKHDYWLHPFEHPKNWFRAFHGTGSAQSQDFGDKSQLFDTQYASVDALSSIFKTGFRPARAAAFGPGVYCSPNPKFPEVGYVRPVPLDTQQGEKSFICMLQVAVNPDGVQFPTNDIWVVPDPKDIRPYGILIKEV